LAFLCSFLRYFVLNIFLKKKTFEPLEIQEEVEPLNERQEKILKTLSSKGEVTVEELMVKVKGVSERTLRRDMKRLEELGFSEKQGSTKGSKYIYTK